MVWRVGFVCVCVWGDLDKLGRAKHNVHQLHLADRSFGCDRARALAHVRRRPRVPDSNASTYSPPRAEVQCPLRLYGSPADSDYLFCEQPVARPDCLAYSFGVNNQVAFEADLARRTGLEVFAFDNHSVATTFMLDGVDEHDHKRRPTLPDNLHYRPLMLWNSSLGALSVPLGIRYGFHGVRETWVFREIREIAHSLGHRLRDLRLLKLDVEGAEFRVLPGLLHKASALEQVTLEVHTHVYDIENDWKLRYASQSEWLNLEHEFISNGFKLASVRNEKSAPTSGRCEKVQYSEQLWVHPERLARRVPCGSALRSRTTLLHGSAAGTLEVDTPVNSR